MLYQRIDGLKALYVVVDVYSTLVHVHGCDEMLRFSYDLQNHKSWLLVWQGRRVHIDSQDAKAISLKPLLLLACSEMYTYHDVEDHRSDSIPHL